MKMQNSFQIYDATCMSSDWWRGGIIYQVYLRSFQDSNGDGVGDLKGITQRLDYIASLGVDAIWISPFFKSPMKDFGYDVSDYCVVDPMFGTMEDFRTLLHQAHTKGLKVMIDLVLSHTSDQHPWFIESRTSCNNEKSDWYVWSDPKLDGTPPNNWLSLFGGSVWQWDSCRQQYYMHNFLVSQPDLNFHCHAVQDVLLDAAKFWLDMGVDGFRLDTINFYFHDQQLRDNPALSVDKRNFSIAPMENPYNYQDHLYSKSQPENIAFLERLRNLTDEYEGRACLGEVGDAQRGLEIMGEYTSGNKRMHMCYVFEFLEKQALTASYIKLVFDKLESKARDAWPCWAFSNHDVQRHSSRWGLTDMAVRQYVVLMMCLRGSACLYQGEELGLYEADVPFDRLQDPYGIEFWPKIKGRDGCRTPMVWTAQSEQSGFSTSEPWLPVNSVQVEQAVDRQENDSQSLLHHYRRAISLRHAYLALIAGVQTEMNATGDLLTFRREIGNDKIFCAFNLGQEDVFVSLPTGEWQTIAFDLGGIDVNQNSIVMLSASQFYLAQRKR